MGPSRDRDGEDEGAIYRLLAGRASMGPSRDRDGESAEAPTVHQAIVSLQWGRRVIATERLQPLARLPRHRQWLQWGRRVIATESAAEVRAGRDDDEASMGPSRDRDGELGTRRFKGRPSQPGFNGAVA